MQENYIYEVSYLLLSSLALEQVPNSTMKIKDAIMKLDGTMISLEDPVLIDIAYPMTKIIGTTHHKCDRGYFGWMKFEISKDRIEAIKKVLDTSDDVLRYLIIKTVRENTLLHGKIMLKKEEKIKKDSDISVQVGDEEVIDETIEPIPVISEDLDKSIDDLVIV